ncbi:MAG: DNA/RNA helicase domain-containing protein, partial [Smithella sp.]
MNRAYYSATIKDFLNTSPEEIFQKIALKNEFPLEQTQRDAWLAEIIILKEVLTPYKGSIYFEYSIPRMGQRIDVVVLIEAVIFILEFKIGEKGYNANAVDQVMDYALDLKNFHESSHEQFIAPILIATKAKNIVTSIDLTLQNDKLLIPIKSNVALLGKVIKEVLLLSEGHEIDMKQWEQGRYCPTPTIIEAAMALYNNHSVEDISRRDASDINLTQTSDAVSAIIRSSKDNSRKSICFVTGVPGAGKTLVGLHIAT